MSKQEPQKTGEALLPRGSNLGTFAGVFTPSILTILGIILFLRLGFVVGEAGLTRALVIILLANGISILTSISISAVATNLRVKGGGDYYLISRTLGVEYGGALGIVLFLAQSVSIAFYAIGFGEAVTAVAGVESIRLGQFVAAGAVSALLVLAWMGADWATRFQYVVMFVIFAALIAFFVGGTQAWSPELIRSNLQPAASSAARTPMPFWAIFAVFFPAVTGFTQGVSMSGDLRKPSRSIPLGTFLAVGISLVVYIGVAIVFAGALPGFELAGNTNAMRRVALFSWIVDAGVIAATLSSALASFLGAPRILQSLAQDRVFPFLNFFSKGHGSSGNPRRGVVLSALIAYGIIALGNLNLIASVVTMFFLVSYGLLNYATYFEARANSPSFRPRFRFFHARLSLFGCLGCLAAMLAINAVAAAIAVAVLYGLHLYVSRSVQVERWADSARSHRLQRVREDLHAIATDLAHTRDWRPVVLAFSDNPGRRTRLLRFASWIEGHSGFTTAVRLIQGGGTRAWSMQQQEEQDLRTEIQKQKFSAFAKAIVTEDIDDAVPVLLQAHGLGPVRANTVLLNWFDRRPDEHGPGLRDYGRYLRMALRFECNVVILSASTIDFTTVDENKPSERRIDVWYRDNATGRLMILLAYLMTRSDPWTDARIRLVAPRTSNQTSEEITSELEQMLEEARIVADLEVVENPQAQDVARLSSGSAMTFLPFRLDDDGPTSVYDAPIDELTQNLGITALVLAARDIVLDSEPEAGQHAVIAEAVDTRAKAQKHAERTENDAIQASQDVEKAREDLEAARSSEPEAPKISDLEGLVRQAEQSAEHKRRRALKARARAESATQEANDVTGGSNDENANGEDEENPPS